MNIKKKPRKDTVEREKAVIWGFFFLFANACAIRDFGDIVKNSSKT